jgi:hypothetical protein
MTDGNDMITAQIEGLWSLVSMEQRYDDGRVVYPFGQDVEGRIFYGADGAMFTAIQKGGRKPFTTGKQWTASPEEKAAAYNDYLTYFGHYRVSGDQVTHFIEISLFPDWIGNCQIRRFRFEDGLLCLSARLEDGTSEARNALMIWARTPENPSEQPSSAE